MFRAQDDTQLVSLLIPAWLAAVRIGGLMLIAPFFGSPALAVPVKAALTVTVTLVLYPAYSGFDAATMPEGNLPAAVAGEFAVGFGIGLTIQIFFEAAQMAGQLLGVQTGLAVASILDPQSQADSPVLAVLNQIVVTLIFLALNVHHALLRVLAHSFSGLPLGSFQWERPWSGLLLHSAGTIWSVGVQIAAPVIAATLMADVAMGFLARAAPQLPVLFLGVSVKNLLGVSVLAGTLGLWPSLWQQHFQQGLMGAERLAHLAR
jgi:flagellar biosynthetic protein FliR